MSRHTRKPPPTPHGPVARCRTFWTAAPLRALVASRWSAILLLLVPAVLLGLSATEAWGCPTCKDGVAATDGAEANIARGYFYSILLMLAMPFTLASCFGLYVWREYRRQVQAGVFDQITVPAQTPTAETVAKAPLAGPLRKGSSPLTVGGHAS